MPFSGFYLLNWIYRWMTEPHYSQWIVWLAGTVQTVLYCDFFYYYVRRYVHPSIYLLCRPLISHARSRLYGSAFKLPK